MKRFTFLVVAALFMNVGFAQSFTPAKDAKALTHRAVGKRTQSPLKTSGFKQSSAELGIARKKTGTNVGIANSGCFACY